MPADRDRPRLPVGRQTWIGRNRIGAGIAWVACCSILVVAMGNLWTSHDKTDSGQSDAEPTATSQLTPGRAAPDSANEIWLGGRQNTDDDNFRSQQTPESSATLDNWSDYTFTQIHMAMPVRLTVWVRDERQARLACRAAFQRISELVQVLSSYAPDSELNRLLQSGSNKPAGHGHQVSADLLTVLSYSSEVFHQTAGAFDPSAGPLTKLWKQARKARQLPSQARLASARERVGFHQISIDALREEVRLSRPNLELDLGGIAKGYVADQALEILRDNGILSACIEAGGDFVVGHAPPGKPGWRIDVPALGTMTLDDCGISISGDTVQSTKIGSKRYSHVVDPRSGIPLTNRIMAVVIAPTAMQSDALATSACILEEDQIQRIVESLPHVRFWRWRVDSQSAEIPIPTPHIPTPHIPATHIPTTHN